MTINKLFTSGLMAAAVLIFSACAVTKTASGPVGSWDVTVMGTPYGDMAGKLVIAGNVKAWKATMNVQGEQINFDQFSHDPKTGKSTGSFYFQGNPVTFQGTQKDAAMEGVMSAGGMDFQVKGSRKD